MVDRKVLHQLIAAVQADGTVQPSISEASDDPVHRELITQASSQAGHPLAEQLNAESPEFYAKLQRASHTAGSNHVPDVLHVPCHHQENSSLPSNVSNPTLGDRATSAANAAMRIATRQQSPDQLSGEHRHPEILPEHEDMIVSYFGRYAIRTLLKAMWNHPRAADAEERLRTYIDHVLLKRKQRIITVPQLLHSISNHVRRSCEAALCIDVLHDRKTLDARGLALFKQQWSRRA